MSSNAAARKASKKKNTASADPPDPNPVIPMESLYQSPEVKEETNPMNINWFDMVNLEQEPVQPSSPFDSEEVLKLWNLQSSPFMFDNALSDLMNQHPVFLSDPQTQPLTLTTTTFR